MPTVIERLIEHCSEMLNEDPNDDSVHLLRGICYLMHGRMNEALEDYTKAIELAPERYEGYLLRSEIHLKRGETSQAHPLYMRASYLEQGLPIDEAWLHLESFNINIMGNILEQERHHILARLLE